MPKKSKSKAVSYTRTYRIWDGIKGRCYIPTTTSYKNYGAKGVTVCERWRESFANFLADMGECPAGLSIDRIDNTKGYSSGNCRWTTRKENNRNRKVTLKVEFRGETKPLATWAEILGFQYETLRLRVSRGWSVERAFTEPVHDRF